jgi:c-di-GMP-binding flagellar brake protein YcgR
MGFIVLNKKEKKVWNTIQPQDKVSISLIDDVEETYVSSVAAVDDLSLDVVTPHLGKFFIELPPKQRVHVEVEVCTPVSGRIKFNSKVTSGELQGRRIIRVARPKRLRWIQLRRYYRVETILDVEYTLVQKGGSPPRLFGLTKNVSERGVLLVTDQLIEIDRDVILDMKIKLAAGVFVKMRGRIVRIEKLLPREKYGIGVDFEKISDVDREILRKFIFERGRQEYLKRR